MKAQLLAIAAGIAVFAGFSPYIPADALHGKWNNARQVSVAEITDGHFYAATDKATNYFRMNALADEAGNPKSPIDVSALYKIEGADYQITHDDTVSLVPVSSNVVKKIEFGRVSEIRVVHTTSGIYSTDGFASDNILYTGINAVRTADNDALGKVILWAGNKGWIDVANPGKGSFVYYGSMNGGGHYMTSKKGLCVGGKGYSGCN